MRISEWSSDVCSSYLATPLDFLGILDHRRLQRIEARALDTRTGDDDVFPGGFCADVRLRAVRRAADHHRAIGVLDHLEALVREHQPQRSEEHTSELQSLMRISYAAFCLKKKNKLI